MGQKMKGGEKSHYIKEGCQNGEGNHKTGALENFNKGKSCFNKNYQKNYLLKKCKNFCLFPKFHTYITTLNLLTKPLSNIKPFVQKHHRCHYLFLLTQ